MKLNKEKIFISLQTVIQQPYVSLEPNALTKGTKNVVVREADA